MATIAANLYGVPLNNGRPWDKINLYIMQGAILIAKERGTQCLLMCADEVWQSGIPDGLQFTNTASSISPFFSTIPNEMFTNEILIFV